MRTLGLCTLALLLASCGDPSAKTGEYAAQGISLDALAAGVDCGCFWPDYGYVSEAACRLDRVVVVAAAQERCAIDVGARYPDFEALSECRLVVASARLNCYYVHDDTCNPDGFDACDDVRDTAFASCPDPCSAMSGSDRSACELERAQLQAETADCFGF
jgi:hypothetical protein